MATVYAKAARSAAKTAECRDAVRKERDKVSRRATSNLERAKKTSRITDEGYFPAKITEAEEVVDSHEHCFTILNAPNALALEFGHNPSGAFGPEGRFAGRQKRPTPGEYILIRAAIGGVVS